MTKPSASLAVSSHHDSVKADKTSVYLERALTNNDDPDGTFLYDWETWGKLFALVLESEAYKAFMRREIDFFIQHKEKFAPYFTDTHIRNIVELGPGDGKKSAEILDAMVGEKLQGKTYRPVEISPYFLDESSQYVQEYFRQKWISIAVAGTNNNFVKSDALKDIQDKVYLIMDTLGNFWNEDIGETLSKTLSDKARGKKSNVVMTYFPLPDKNDPDYEDQVNTLKATYGDPDTQNPHYNESTHRAIKDRVMGGFASLTIDTDALEFQVKYEESEDGQWRMLVGAKVVKSLTIKHEGRIYTKEVGEDLWAIQSRRFSPEYIKDLIKKKGGDVLTEERGNDIGIIAFAAARSPEKKEKVRQTKKVWALVSGIAFLLAVALVWGMQLEKNNATKRKADESKNITKKRLETHQIQSPDDGRYLGTSVDFSETIRKTTSDLYEKIIERYEVPPGHEDELKALIADAIENENGAYVVHQEGDQYGMGDIVTTRINEFIEKNIILAHPHQMKERGIDLLPLHHFMKYKNEMLNTVLADRYISLPLWWVSEGAYHGMSDGWYTDIGQADFNQACVNVNMRVVKANNENKKIVIAQNKFNDKSPFTVDLGKDASLHILFEASATLRSLMEIYYIYCPHLKEMGFYAKAPIAEKLLQTVSDTYHSLPDELAPLELHRIVTYTMTDTPYLHLQGLLTSYDPKTNDFEKREDDPMLFGTESGWVQKNYNFDPVNNGKYITSDGIIYQLATIKVRGKSYLVANKVLPYENRLDHFSTDNANIVLADYQKLMRERQNYREEKAILDQKGKSEKIREHNADR